MLCLDKEKAIALAFSRPSSLFVFIFIYPGKLCFVLLLSNALHTHSLMDIKTWELPSTTPVWCQSAALLEQLAVKHLAQGHLNRSCWRSKKKSMSHSLLVSRFSSLLRSQVCFLNFCLRADASPIFKSPFSSCFFHSNPSFNAHYPNDNIS